MKLLISGSRDLFFESKIGLLGSEAPEKKTNRTMSTEANVSEKTANGTESAEEKTPTTKIPIKNEEDTNQDQERSKVSQGIPPMTH